MEGGKIPTGLNKEIQIEINVANGQYLKAYTEKDIDWFVTIEDCVRITFIPQRFTK